MDEERRVAGVAINVGANTTLPGVRGPIYPDGRFRYVPIPEREPIDDPAPTYADLDLPVEVPDEYRDRPVHLDPEFEGYPHCRAYTYGDEHGVKAGPLSALSAGDHVFFYATLSTRGDDPADWIAPKWGAYLIGHFRLGMDPVTGEDYETLDPADREKFANNAHVKRETFDARVLLWGDPEESALYDRAVPLSNPSGGADANRLVTDLSADSGKGPWWRRPLRFDADGVEALLKSHRTGEYGAWLDRSRE
ncbi:MAG TPA: hypothetical protein VJ898_13875 [Natrialbaceae archaeon]|nr:hypothetical protein [Natrialbaceae archaeon]